MADNTAINAIKDMMPPFVCVVKFEQSRMHSGAPYLAQVLKHRGVGYVPAPLVSGLGSTSKDALNALSETLRRNDWLSQYYSWSLLVKSLETPQICMDLIPQTKEVAE